MNDDTTGKNLATPPEQTAGPDQITQPESPSKIDVLVAESRAAIAKLLRGLAVGGGLSAGIYTAKQAVDATPPAVQEIMTREFHERSAEMQQFVDKNVQISKDLAVEILQMLILLKGKVSWDDAATLLLTLYDGFKNDVKEFIVSGGDDMSPNQILNAVDGLIDKDEQLDSHWEKVKALVGQLLDVTEELESLKQQLTSFDEQDKREAWETFEGHFWREMKKPFQSL